jgi:hypothetical protein
VPIDDYIDDYAVVILLAQLFMANLDRKVAEIKKMTSFAGRVTFTLLTAGSRQMK